MPKKQMEGKKKSKKQTTKKIKKKNKQRNQQKSKSKQKLHPGKKQCKNCSEIIPIHQKVCTNCGYVHEMKKKKNEIMKNLNKITPIVIKSIIESNEFNQFVHWNEHQIFNVGLVEIKQDIMQEEKVKKNKKKQVSCEKSELFSYKFQNVCKKPYFQVLTSEYPIICLANSKDCFIFVEQIQKKVNKFTQNQQLTIKAHSLENYHCFGIDYFGKSRLLVSTEADSTFDEIYINRHVMKIKLFCNLVVLMSGFSTLIVFSLPVGSIRKNKNQKFKYNLKEYTEIVENKPDRITVFEFLRGSIMNENQNQGILIVTGTAYGHISIYCVSDSQYFVKRYFPFAHREMITCISECPLNSRGQGIIFASGCYDGTVSIWDMEQKNKLYSFESSNRKIWSIVWDPGAKFIFINRDQIYDSSIIACFFSINKIQTVVHLANTMELRNIKNQKNRSITSHDFYSKFIPSLDPVRGTLKMLSLEDLRGNSLKKKKPKKEQNCEKLFRINFDDNNMIFIEELNEEPGKEEESSKKFPLFSDIIIQNKSERDFIYISTYAGHLIRYIHAK